MIRKQKFIQFNNSIGEICVKVYVEYNGKYLLINEENVYSNENDYYKKQEFISEAMDKLEEKRLTMEVYHQKHANYKVKKLGEYKRNNVA